MKFHYLLTILLSLILSACGDGSGNANNNGPSNPPLLVNSSGYSQIDYNTLTLLLTTYKVGVLSAQEEAGLLQMREEEKMAGDVYSALYNFHQLPIFANIAASEDTHAAAVKLLLDRYNLADPVLNLSAGEFSSTQYQTLYDDLVYQGTPTLLAAFKVGILIEELDIFDLTNLKAQVVDNADILLVYDNLQKGSRNHLRAFYRQLISIGGTYTPQYLTQEQFDAIVNSPIETGQAG